ncbi:MAG: helix-turn-helix domain-containing protein [Bacteroidota bacterium]
MPTSSQITLLKNGIRIPAAPQEAVKSALNWQGFIVEHHSLVQGELPTHTILDHRLTITLNTKAIPFEYKEKGVWRQLNLQPGSFSMQQHGDTGTPRWLQDFNFLAIALSPKLYDSITAEEMTAQQVVLKTQRGKEDAHISSFIPLFQQVLTHPNTYTTLFKDALAMTFALYLLNRYGLGTKKITEPKGKLLGIPLKRLIDFLYAHLHEEITLQTLAEQTNLSPYHFAKLFKHTFGMPPHQFVLQARIEKAQFLIQHSTDTLTTIAHATGFYDQSHFTRSFKRIVGSSPKQY